VSGPTVYAYVGGNPTSLTDPLGLWTGQIGINISFNVFGILTGNVSAGIAVDGQGNVAGYSAVGPGVSAGASVSGGISLQGSNGNTIYDLNGPFANVSVGGGAGVYASADGFIGYGVDGQKVGGGGVTIGVGIGASTSATITNTQVRPIGATGVGGGLPTSGASANTQFSPINAPNSCP
jgi:hypothetical protein